MANHSSIFAWRIPWTVFFLGEPHGQRSLEGYSPWGRKELNVTEQLSAYTHTHIYTHTVNWTKLKVVCLSSYHILDKLIYFGCAGSSLRCAGSPVVVCRLSYPEARRILVPWSGINPSSPELEHGFLTAGSPKKGKSLDKLLRVDRSLLRPTAGNMELYGS